MYNLQVRVTRVKRLVKYLERPRGNTDVKRFAPDRQPCSKVKSSVLQNGKLVTITEDCNCRCCKAHSKTIAEIMASNPRAYRIVVPKLK